jgi:hypothetical protein
MKIPNAMLLACGFVLAIAPAAAAQTPDQPARAFISVGGGYQSASQDVTTSGSFTLYDEPGSFTGSRTIGEGPFFDIGGGVHLFGQVSAGFSYSRYVESSDVPFTVVVPHPLYFNQPRTVTMNVNDLGHTEDWFHFKLYYQLFSSSRFDASISGGASVVSVQEDTVKEVTATETGSPYTAVNLTATFESASKTAVGYNVGVEFNYHLTGSFGAGAFFRYTGATADLPWDQVKVGGPQVGAQLRYTF